MNPLTAEIATAQNSDNKLILIIGGPGSGKSKLIHDYSNETGIPILNLDQIFKDDCSEIITVMNDFIDNYDKKFFCWIIKESFMLRTQISIC